MKIVDSNPGNFHDTASGETRSPVGELKRRAQSILFLLCKLNSISAVCTGDLKP